MSARKRFKRICESSGRVEFRWPSPGSQQTGRTFCRYPGDTIDLLRLLEANYDDRMIAMILARQGGLPPLGYTFTKTRAARLRVENKIPVPSAESVIPADDDALMVGIAHAEPILGVSKVTININRWLREGFIAGRKSSRWSLANPDR